MKLVFKILILLTLIFNPLYAKNSFYIAPRVGVNSSTINGYSDSILGDFKLKQRIGANLGINISFFTQNNIMFGTDLAYEFNGARFYLEKNGNFLNYTSSIITDNIIQLEYITFSTNFGYLIKTKKFNIVPTIKPKFSYLVSSKIKSYTSITINEITSDSTVTQDYDETSQTDFGINFDVSINLINNVYFETGYYLGLIDINKDNEPKYNRNFHFLIGYKIKN